MPDKYLPNPFVNTLYAPTQQAEYTISIVDSVGPRPEHDPIIPRPATLHAFMKGFIADDYTEGWNELLPSHSMIRETIRRAQASVRIKPWFNPMSEEQFVSQWCIKIWGKMELTGVEKPIMGFHPANGLSVKDMFALVYLMLAKSIRKGEWRIQAKDGSSPPLDWECEDPVVDGDYRWTLRESSVVSFAPAADFWNGVQPSEPKPTSRPVTGANTPSDIQFSLPQTPVSSAPNLVNEAPTSDEPLNPRINTPKELVRDRDHSACLLCGLSCRSESLAEVGKVAHIIPIDRPEAFAWNFSSFDPAAYITPAQYKETDPFNGSAIIPADSAGKSEKIARDLPDHPSNLFMGCTLCERLFDARILAVNVFTSPPKRILALTYPADEDSRSRDLLVYLPGHPVDLKISAYGPDIPSIFPSELVLAIHLGSFLARRCHVGGQDFFDPNAKPKSPGPKKGSSAPSKTATPSKAQPPRTIDCGTDTTKDATSLDDKTNPMPLKHRAMPLPRVDPGGKRTGPQYDSAAEQYDGVGDDSQENLVGVEMDKITILDPAKEADEWRQLRLDYTKSIAALP